MRGSERRKQTPVLQEVAHLSLALSNFPGSCIHLTCSICVVIVKQLCWVSFCRNFCLAKPSIESESFDVETSPVRPAKVDLILSWRPVHGTQHCRVGQPAGRSQNANITLNLHPNVWFIDSSLTFTISEVWVIWTLLQPLAVPLRRELCTYQGLLRCFGQRHWLCMYLLLES